MGLLQRERDCFALFRFAGLLGLRGLVLELCLEELLINWDFKVKAFFFC